MLLLISRSLKPGTLIFMAFSTALKDRHVEIFVALWLTMGLGAGLIARAKGYSFIGWFIYGFFLGFIAFLHSIMIRARFQSEHGF